jgi:hypothetical protein
VAHLGSLLRGLPGTSLPRQIVRFLRESSASCLGLAGLMLLLSGCRGEIPSYSIPPQRTEFPQFRPYRASHVINMADADSNSHFVQDIEGMPGEERRWTGKRPIVKVTLTDSAGLRYKIDFVIADVTLKDTGPVTMTFFVNDHVVDKVRYSDPGEQHFEKPVPAEWVEVGKDTLAGVEIDKVWVSPQDGKKLGFLLTRLGLESR